MSKESDARKKELNGSTAKTHYQQQKQTTLNSVKSNSVFPKASVRNGKNLLPRTKPVCNNSLSE